MNTTDLNWQQTERIAHIYKLLSNPHRLMVICILLEHQELCVGELNQYIHLNASPLSQHLKILRDEHLVNTRKQGQTVFYSICDTAIAQLIDVTKQLYCSKIAV